MTAVETYEQVHFRLRDERGPARDYSCAHGCGKTAQHWAYGHSDPDVPPERLFPYSSNLDHYLPLCAKCHNAFDAEHYAVDRVCGLCGNAFRGHFMRVYCSDECRDIVAAAKREARAKPKARASKVGGRR